MINKIITMIAAAAMVTAAGGAVYADSCGVFRRDNDAAKAVVDKSMEAVMKSYRGDDVSFRGIVKEGCDFWYYNEYNNELIGSISRCAGLADEADYTVDYSGLTYSGSSYTVTADVTQHINYRGMDEPIDRTTRHTFTVAQDGCEMYIVSDDAGGAGNLLTISDIL